MTLPLTPQQKRQRENARRWRANPEYRARKLAMQRKRRRENAEVRNASHKCTAAWRAKNQERIKATQRAYLRANRDRINARSLKYYYDHREHITEQRRRRYAKNIMLERQRMVARRARKARAARWLQKIQAIANDHRGDANTRAVAVAMAAKLTANQNRSSPILAKSQPHARTTA